MTCGSSTCECATALPNALTAISDNPIANLIKRVVLSGMTIFTSEFNRSMQHGS